MAPARGLPSREGERAGLQTLIVLVRGETEPFVPRSHRLIASPMEFATSYCDLPYSFARMEKKIYRLLAA